ncbi:MAG: MFS transporter [Lentisphaeria bacterium]|nr:MFS transporter [Lentisphaeria bacterium]
MSTTSQDNDQLRCGTLRYTMPKLVMLLIWIMLGEAIIALGTQLPNRMLPVQMKGMVELPETWRVFILTTIGGILNWTVCPYISVASDWHRGRLGRRIPYILASTAPIALSLILFGFSQRFGEQLSSWVSPFWNTSPWKMTAIIIGLVMFLFQFFNMWVNSVIYYIFNDVVPPKYHAQANAFFRIGGSAGMAIFNIFFFRYADEHATVIWVTIGIIYAVLVTLFCFFVKEGEYPPLTEEQLAAQNLPLLKKIFQKFIGIKSFLKDSFYDRVYIYNYCLTIASALTYCMSSFNYFFQTEMGLDTKDVGNMDGVNGIIGVTGIGLVLLTSVFVNRWNPVRIGGYMVAFNLTFAPTCFRWFFGTLPPNVYLIISVLNTAGMLVLANIASVSAMPTLMRIFPKSRFGSFCAMQSLIRSFVVMLISLMGGALLDFLKLKVFVENPNFSYRIIEAWRVPWDILAFIFFFLLYRRWGKLNGMRNYKAPAGWEPSGFETMDPVEASPRVKPVNLLRMLWIGDAFLLLFTLAFPAYAYFHCHYRQLETELFASYLIQPTCIMLVADILWILLRLYIAFDAKRVLKGLVPHTGLLHPALTILVFITTGAQTAIRIVSVAYSTGSFAITSLNLCAGNILMLVIVVAVLSWMEHGIPQPEERA